MDLAETVLMGADIPNAQPMRSAFLSLLVGSIDEAERIYAALSVYAALSEGGEIFMPMRENFFAYRFAPLRDRFGTSWIATRRLPGYGSRGPVKSGSRTSSDRISAHSAARDRTGRRP